MLTIILADRSRIRVESCPVPMLSDFPEWHVYAHNVITEDGVDESRWCATEATTGHAFPGDYATSDAAALGAMSTLRRWGRRRAATAYSRTRRALGPDYPLNDVRGRVPAAPKPEYHYGPRKQPPEREGTIWAACRAVLAMSPCPLSCSEIHACLPQFTLRQIRQAVQDHDRVRTGKVVRCHGRYMLPEGVTA